MALVIVGRLSKRATYFGTSGVEISEKLAKWRTGWDGGALIYPAREPKLLSWMATFPLETVDARAGRLGIVRRSRRLINEIYR